MVISAISMSATQLAAESKGAHPRSGSHTYSDGGVTVRKNSDGTVETFDSGSAPQSVDSGDAPVMHTVQSHPYSKNIGGVHVRRNADGTIETYEPPSKPEPLYPVAHRSKPVQRHHK
ncbi:MAG TPA: hypothetical protein V6C76_13950 [Drouetiella sp.]